MSDLPPTPPADAPPSAAAAAPAPAAPSAPVPPLQRRSADRGRGLRLTLAFILLLVSIGLVLGWWKLRTDLDRLQTELEHNQRLLSAADEQAAQRDRDAQLRLERLEGEITRLRDQRAELDALYLDLTRGRDEAALVEVERLVALAAQELQISGNLTTALAALQSADSRLSRVDRPQLVNVRRAITRDIERLRAAPSVDVTGLALKLDQLLQGIDALPLLAEAGARPAVPAKKAEPKAEAKPVQAPDTASAWARARAWLQQEFGDLVRIREVDTPEALLLNAQQQQLVRQQLKLRLLAARQGLLTRNDRLYRADLAQAQELVNRYYDTRQTAAATLLLQLKQLASAPLSVDLPQVSDSIAALAALRGGLKPQPQPLPQSPQPPAAR